MAKYIIILLVTVLSFSANSANANFIDNSPINETTTKTPSSTKGQKGIIVMEEDIMGITVSNDDEISKVYIYKYAELVGTESGCGSHQCEYNLSKLPSGIYQIVVVTKNNNQYAEQIML